MKSKIALNKKRKSKGRYDNMLKATSLLYFKEALFKERYEDLRGLLKTAKRYGVEDVEVQKILGRHVKRLQAAQQNEAIGIRNNRIRF